MNHKKIMSFILVFLVTSSTLPYMKTIALADETTDALNYIINHNSETGNITDISSKQVLRYDIVTSDKEKLDEVLNYIGTNYNNIVHVIESDGNTKITIQMPPQCDFINNLKNQGKDKYTITDETTNFTISEDNTISDFSNDEEFCISKDSNYIKVTSMNDKNNIIPVLALNTDLNNNGKALICEICTISNDLQVNATKTRYSNISNGIYKLESIDTSNLCNITVKYYIVDSNNSVISRAEKTILYKSNPSLSINSVKYTNNSSSPILEFKVQALKGSGDTLLAIPAIYINGSIITPDSINYDIANAVYDVKVKVPNNKNWTLDFYAADDFLDEKELVLTSDMLIHFNNINLKNDFVIGINNKVYGVLSSVDKFNSLKINDVNVNCDSKDFTSTIESTTNSIKCNYNYTPDSNTGFPVEYDSNIISSNDAPTYNANTDTITVYDNKFTISGSIADTDFPNLAVIDCIEYDYNTTKSFIDKKNINFDASTGKFSANLNLPLPQNSETQTTTNIIVTGENPIGNKSSYNFNVILDKSNDNYDLNFTTENGVYCDAADSYYNGNVTPCLTINDSDIDKNNSFFEIKRYKNKQDSVSGTVISNTTMYLNDGKQIKEDSNKYSLVTPLAEDGYYVIVADLIDKDGYSLPTIQKSIGINKTSPVVSYEGLPQAKATSYYCKDYTPVIDIKDFWLKQSDLTNSNVITVKVDGIVETVVSNNIVQSIDENGDTVYKVQLLPIDTSSPNPHKISVDINDNTGNEFNSDSNDIYIDNEAPTIQITDNNNSIINDDAVINNSIVKIFVKDNLLVNCGDISVMENDVKIDDVSMTELMNSDGSFQGWEIDRPVNDGLYNFTVTAKDAAGNETNITKKFTIDKTAPSITINGINSDNGAIEYTNKDVNGNISIADTNLSSGNVTVTKDDKVIENENIGKAINESFNYSDEGAYVITATAKDAAGNETSETKKFTIDKTAPGIGINSDNGDIEYINKEVKGNITITDVNLSSGNITVTKDNKVIENENMDKGTYEIFHYTDDGVYVITVTAKDAAGNETSETKKFTIDKTAPSIVINGISSDNGTIEYTNKEVNGNISITDTNLISGNITVTEDNKVIENKDIDKETGENFHYTVEGAYVITVTAKDAAGNETTEKKSFTIDETAPSIVINGINSDNGTIEYTNKEVNGNISIADTNLISGNITVTKDNKVIENEDIHKETSEDFHYADEGAYVITVTAKDAVGNVTTEKKSFTIDETAPSIVINGINSDNGTIEYTNKEVNGNISINDTNLSSGNITVTKDNKVIENEDIDKAIDEIFNYTDEGIYVITVTAKDAAGNETSETKKFTIDETAPSIGISGINSDNGTIEYTNKDVSGDISINDTNLSSGNVTVTKDNKVIENEDIDKAIDEIFNYTDEGNYVITVTAKDAAGNVTNVIKKFTIDKTAPVLQNLIKDNKYYRSSGDLLFNIAETNLDMEKSNLTVSKVGTKDVIYQLSDIDNNNGKFTLDNTLKSDGQYDITFHIQDLAGNSIDDTHSTFFLDTLPVSKVDIINIGTVGSSKNGINYYTSNVKPEITFNDEFLDKNDVNNKDLIYATLTKHDLVNNTFVTLPYSLNADTFKKDGNNITIDGDEISTQSDENTTYSVKVYVRDKTGRDNAEAYCTATTESFVIDKTNPKITFRDADGRNIVNGNYYQGKVTPVFQITDNYNVNSYKYTITRNGEDITDSNSCIAVPCTGGYILNGSSVTEDGDYTITVTSADETIKNTAAYSISFTIDNTKPVIKITGVKDNEYNNKNVTTPVIEIDDTNVDISKTIFNLTKDGEYISINPTLNDNIFSFNLSDEGKYNLSVTAYDKAKNSYTTSTITFTIDRTKPIVKINANEGEYINKQFRPVITTENPLDTVNEVIINGEPVDPNNIPILSDNKEYEIKARAVDKSGNISDESTVHFVIDTVFPEVDISGVIANFFYNKTISPAVSIKDDNIKDSSVTLNGQPFYNSIVSQEGNYELKASGEDKADNVTARVVNFVIDKTAPTINVEGLMSGKIFNSIIDPLINVNDDGADVSLLLDGEDYHGEAIKKDGKHTLIVKAIDKAGNESQSVMTFFLKTTAPVVKISGVENGKTYYNSVTPIVTFSDDVASGKISSTLDGKAYNLDDCISTLGKHVLTVSAVDEAGNKTIKKVAFSISNVQKSSSLNFLEMAGASILAVILALCTLFTTIKRRKRK